VFRKWLSKSETGGFLDLGNRALFFQKIGEAGGVGIFSGVENT
jgi:hypothetical protein